MRIINEPTAAALALNHLSPPKEGADPPLTVVFDLGGGTFDIAVVIMARAEVRVLAS